ncbi:hypothetical protein AV654_19815 [Paenibacillus elgii]|uniref:Uncharacterized protein n=1 Tax=Paenibacillus elgii TaxID=189691 RepID=A0A163XPE5_9BACL|nr:hypothetical protein [Paenibacillus elgii]KZE78223.1 hypothetical protein AV654_19815 [Paenibacillus elgii]
MLKLWPLTTDEKSRIIHRCLDLLPDQFIIRHIYAAAVCGEDPVEASKQALGIFSTDGDTTAKDFSLLWEEKAFQRYRVSGNRSGLRVIMEDGRKAVISHEEVVHQVLNHYHLQSGRYLKHGSRVQQRLNRRGKQDRLQAYEEDYLGEQQAVDIKGVWSYGDLKIDRYEKETDSYNYMLYIRVDPADPTKSDRSLYRVFANEKTTKERLKRDIQESKGITPNPLTMDRIWYHFLLLRNAHQEEKRALRRQNKAKAAEQLDRLLTAAVDRYRGGESLYDVRIAEHLSRWQRYLTEAEREQTIELQMVINGHKFRCRSHMVEFSKRFEAFAEEIDKAREALQRQQKRERLHALLQVDDKLQFLVALYRDIRKAGRGSYGVEYELVHSLFGYTTCLDEFREKYSQFSKLMERLGLEWSDTESLRWLASEYPDLLPSSVKATFVREEGKFYYGDKIKLQSGIRTVNRVGRKYVYLSDGRKYDIAEARRALIS